MTDFPPLSGADAARVLSRRYRLDAPLCEGGMGRLFRGWHLALDCPIAIKLLKPAGGGREVRRAIREARTAASIRHPNVVQVLDVGDDSELGPFVVMELLSGVSLQQRLEAEHSVGVEQALECVLPIFGAVAVLHERELLHRDIKPANVVLTAPRPGVLVPKLVDFGLARATDASSGAGGSVTRSGVVAGTPDFNVPRAVAGPRRVGGVRSMGAGRGALSMLGWQPSL